MKAGWSGLSRSRASPSIVVTNAPSISPIVTWHARTAAPSISTVHAPQSPVPHPYLAPVRLDASRKAQSKGVSGAKRYSTGWLLTVKRVMRALLEFDSRSEEHTSELQSLMRISYAVFCLKKKKKNRARQQNSRSD